MFLVEDGEEINDTKQVTVEYGSGSASLWNVD